MRAREKKDMVVSICPDCKGKGERMVYHWDVPNEIKRCERCWGSGRIMTTTIIQETPYYKPE